MQISEIIKKLFISSHKRTWEPDSSYNKENPCFQGAYTIENKNSQCEVLYSCGKIFLDLLRSDCYNNHIFCSQCNCYLTEIIDCTCYLPTFREHFWSLTTARAEEINTSWHFIIRLWREILTAQSHILICCLRPACWWFLCTPIPSSKLKWTN